jgi:predicted Zn-ribbon and HTH transcriptional regulator
MEEKSLREVFGEPEPVTIKDVFGALLAVAVEMKEFEEKQKVTPLVCQRCGFTWVGHQGDIPGNCGLFTAVTFSVCEIKPKEG